MSQYMLKEFITPQLKQGPLSENTDSDIETLLALKPTYSTYAEQYFIITNLNQIVHKESEKLRAGSYHQEVFKRPIADIIKRRYPNS